MALYQAKSAGRGIYHFFDADMNERAQARKLLETEMRQALKQGEFLLYFQPIADTATGRIVGAEALVRWDHPERGIVLPGEFIPVAESTGLIVELGAWVLRETCAQAVAWSEAGLPPIEVAANISAVQFKRAGLVDTLARAIEETGLDPARLTLEITETVVMENLASMTTLLNRLHDLGVGLAIDDFGTGYSSFSYLKQLPVDKLKIDRSFLINVATDPADAAIATALITLSKQLNLETIAEGVETEAQLEFLRQQGCSQVQGYLLSPPLPADQFVAWYNDQQRTRAPGAGPVARREGRRSGAARRAS